VSLKVRLMPENKTLELEASKIRVGELVRRIGVPAEMVVVLRNGQPVTSDETVGEEDDVVVMRAVSGG